MSINDESTILKGRTVSPKTPARQYVRDLLGDPDHIDISLSDLSFDQKRDLALIRVMDRVEDLHDRGCGQHGCIEGRLVDIEGTIGKLVFGVKVLGYTAGVVLFVFTVVQFIKTQ